MGIKQTYQTIKNQTEKIKYAQRLPAKEGYLLLTSNKYETGSDYSFAYLRKRLGKLTGFEECYQCGGTGREWLTTPDGLADKDICSICWGEGYFKPE